MNSPDPRQNDRRNKMARTRRTISAREKYETKKAEVDKLRDKLAKAEDELKELEKKVDEEKKKELLELIMSSGKSESEIKEFFGKTE